MPQIKIALALLLLLLLSSTSSALDERGRAAGENAGSYGLSKMGTQSGLDARSKMPLTDQNTQLQTFDGSQQGTATAFCGQGTVQGQKQAISVSVAVGSIYVSTDTNNDGYLDASGTFLATKVCHSGYQNGGSYYAWSVDVNGIVSSVSSGSPLDGCVDPGTAPPSYTGGKIAQLYANMTGRQITKSETSGNTVYYYSGSVTDCNNISKNITQTKYYNDPYSMESDGTAQLSATCPTGDDYCLAYRSAPSGVSNAYDNASGNSGQAGVSCHITRTIIDAKGPHDGIICEAGKLYYASGYSDTNQYCMSSQSKWDYNSMFRIRCNQYGSEMTLEGWAYWEGAPCGNSNYANYPPDNQISRSLSYGGILSDQIIGQLSVNRRVGGDNVSPNDLEGSATLCYSNITPLTVHLSSSCPSTNEYCQYGISVEHAPACGSFSITLAPPPGEDIANSCTIYEQQAGCKLKDETWYDAQGNAIATMSNGTPTNNQPPETCQNFPVAGTVCKDWWRKERRYQCAGTSTAYTPDTTRAMAAATSANNDAGNSVQFSRSAFNKENTSNCMIEATATDPSATASPCSAAGGSMQSGGCVTKQYLTSTCRYQNAATKSGLYCDTTGVPTIPNETSRQVYRDCIEQSQCNMSCVIRVPDASQPSGYGTKSVSCIDGGNNTYSCPNGGNLIIKDCDCTIVTWDPAQTKGEDCEVACLVNQYGSEASSNVTRDYLLLTCNKTYLSGNPTPQYACPLSGGQTLHQDCACVDTFGLSAGVLGALSQAVKDRECQ